MIRVKKHCSKREREKRRKRGEREREMNYSRVLHAVTWHKDDDWPGNFFSSVMSEPICSSDYQSVDLSAYLSVRLTCNAFLHLYIERFYMYCNFCNINMYTSTHMTFLSYEGDDFKALFCEEKEGRKCWHMHALTHQN